MALPATPLLDPAVLAQVKDLRLVARTLVDGAVTGLHRQPRAGIEFAVPGQVGVAMQRVGPITLVGTRIGGRAAKHGRLHLALDVIDAAPTQIALRGDAVAAIRLPGQAWRQFQHVFYLVVEPVGGAQQGWAHAFFARDRLDRIAVAPERRRQRIRERAEAGAVLRQ